MNVKNSFQSKLKQIASIELLLQKKNIDAKQEKELLIEYINSLDEFIEFLEDY